MFSVLKVEEILTEMETREQVGSDSQENDILTGLTRLFCLTWRS